ncbi:unnamed protein product, partial [Effrenium voratum]
GFRNHPQSFAFSDAQKKRSDPSAGGSREESPAMKSRKTESQETTCSKSTGLTSEFARAAQPEARSTLRLSESTSKATRSQQRLDVLLDGVNEFPEDFVRWISRTRTRMDTIRDSEDLDLWRSRGCDLMGPRGPRKARVLQISL